MNLADRTNGMFVASLNRLAADKSRWGYGYILNYIESIVVLCVDVLFSSSPGYGTIGWLDEILKCFDFDNVEDINKAISGSGVGDVCVTGIGLSIRLDMGENKPNFLYYAAILLRIIAKKYQRLQEPERAKKAAVTAALYVQACADLLKQRKKAAAAHQLYMPILLFDHGPVPKKYSYNIEAAVEREYELTERNIERLGRKIKAQIAKLSENEEVKND